MPAIRHCRNADGDAVADNAAARGDDLTFGAGHRSVADSGRRTQGKWPRNGGNLDLVAFDKRGDLRKILDLEHVAFAQNDGPEHGVLELAHIAGPGIGEEHLQRPRRDAMDATALFGGKAENEVVDERWNVLLALAQRRHEDRKDIEPV